MNLRQIFRSFSRRVISRAAFPKSQLKVESLESRLVPYALSGNAWPHPELVTLSFQPDGTNLGGVTSNLFSTMDARWATSVWQREILRAAQVWAQVTNLNFALVSDSGTDSGSGNYQQGDSTFGDIRIGAYNSGGSNLGSALMPPPVNNYSAAGDFTLNSTPNWVINQGGGYDLFTVAAHEIGHTLGLYHSTVSSAEEYSFYNAIKSTLRSDDIAGIRANYSGGLGRSADLYDAVLSNGSFATATDLTASISPQTLTALVQNLDLTTTGDHDYYSFVAPVGTTGNLTVNVQSSGLSMLMPTLTVYNAAQEQIGFASGAGQYGSTLSATINGVTAGQLFYVKVSPAETSAFGTGKYALTLNFGSGASPTVPLPNTQTANGSPISGGGGIATREGTEVRVNQTIDGAQAAYSETANRNAVAMNNAGYSVVTWSSYAQDGDGWGVYARLYNSNGTPYSDEFRVNQDTVGDQLHAAVGVDDNGAVVIAWASRDADGSWGIRAQRLAPFSGPLGPDIVVADGLADQNFPTIAMNALGETVISWTSQGQDGSGQGVYARRYDILGNAQGDAFLVNTTTAGDQTQPSVAMDAAGGLVFVWTSQDAGASNVYAKLYDEAGQVFLDEFLVNSTTSGAQEQPSVAMADDGDFVATWSSWGQDGNGWGVYTQRFTLDGQVRGPEIRVNSSVGGDEWFSSVSSLGNGATVISWTALDGAGATTGIFAQQYDAAGEKMGPEILVNTTLSGSQWYPSVAASTTDGFIVVWSGEGDGDVDGVFAQRYQILGGGGVANAEDDFYGIADHDSGCGCSACVAAIAQIGTSSAAIEDMTSASRGLELRGSAIATAPATDPATVTPPPAAADFASRSTVEETTLPMAAARKQTTFADNSVLAPAAETSQPEDNQPDVHVPVEAARLTTPSAGNVEAVGSAWMTALDTYFAGELIYMATNAVEASAESNNLNTLAEGPTSTEENHVPLGDSPEGLASVGILLGGLWLLRPEKNGAGERRSADQLVGVR